MDLKIEFGKKIKQYRKALNLTQEKFAELIDINRTTVARIEKGTNFPNCNTIESIKKVFNVEYRDLFSFDKQVTGTLNSIFESRLSKLNEADIQYFITTIDAYLLQKEINKNHHKL